MMIWPADAFQTVPREWQVEVHLIQNKRHEATLKLEFKFLFQTIRKDKLNF